MLHHKYLDQLYHPPDFFSLLQNAPADRHPKTAVQITGTQETTLEEGRDIYETYGPN